MSLRPVDAVPEGCPCPSALARCGVRGSAVLLVPSRLGLVESLTARREEARLSLGYRSMGSPTLRMVTILGDTQQSSCARKSMSRWCKSTLKNLNALDAIEATQ
jgi:hypothetical protein